MPLSLLNILDAAFVTSAVAAEDFPREGLAEIAFVGRSNVGKSTLINALAQRPLARTSAAPGKTRLANFYRVTLKVGPGSTAVYLVDLPGYGYARGGAEARQAFDRLGREYFEDRASLKPGPVGVLVLVDSRHSAQDSDLAAYRWLLARDIATTIVATKIDKLSRSERTRALRELETSFGARILPVSAAQGEGMEELWRLIVHLTIR